MAEPDWKKLRGLKRLVHDGVDRGASFVEKHHRHAAAKPFDILESVDPLAAPTKVVRTIHDGVLSVVYGSIRSINGLTEVADDWVVDQLESEGATADSAGDATADDDAGGSGAGPGERTPATESDGA